MFKAVREFFAWVFGFSAAAAYSLVSDDMEKPRVPKGPVPCSNPEATVWAPNVTVSSYKPRPEVLAKTSTVWERMCNGTVDGYVDADGKIIASSFTVKPPKARSTKKPAAKKTPAKKSARKKTPAKPTRKKKTAAKKR